MKYNYLFHLLVWMLPIVIGQWIIGWKIFRRHIDIIVTATLLFGSYYTFSDWFAVDAGVWYFDQQQILGIHFMGLPLEEILFFYLTSLLVVQSLILFLPERLRRTTS